MSKNGKQSDGIEIAGLAISAASLGVGILALCLNEKNTKDKMNRIDSSKYSSRRDLKKAYAKEIRKAAVTDIGYSGTVIVLNEKGVKRAYGLVPLENRKDTQSKGGVQSRQQKSKESWVAMEMDSSNGGQRQAIVCSSEQEARERALAMKNAHRKGSRKSRDCRQGYAKMDTTGTIDVAACFSGRDATVHRV